MFKKLLYIFIAAVTVLSLCACEEEQEAISGTPFDPEDYAPETIERYEHRNYGIIIEYPSSFSNRVGNLELDGYITFEKEDATIFVYVPDYDNNRVLFVEEYAEDILELSGDEGSGIARFGKSNGYKAIEKTDEKTRIDFVVKGVDAFYRFAYETTDENFTEADETFLQVMGSIRIDDGVYNKLTSMVSRYKVLLEYAESMQYVSDINYVNHSLNNFLTTGEERHRETALKTCRSVREEIIKIRDYERTDGDLYEKEWEEIVEKASEVIDCCNRIETAINGGDISAAQKTARTEVSYELSELSAGYLSIINAEIAEY